MKRTTTLLFIQLGSPLSPKVSHVRAYLKNFLGERRVIDLPPLFWKLILWFIILPFRSPRSASKYKRVWNKEKKEFPFDYFTQQFCSEVSKNIKNFGQTSSIEVEYAYFYSKKLIPEKIENLLKKIKQRPFSWQQHDIYLVPLFPQFAESTHSLAMDKVWFSLQKETSLTSLSYQNCFHRAKCFIDYYVDSFANFFFKNATQPTPLPLKDWILTFHGLPLTQIENKGDPYLWHCLETFFLIKQQLQQKFPNIYKQVTLHLSFQSRVGKSLWLRPYTDEYAITLAQAGAKHLVLSCPSFVSDCLETTDEIGHELQEEIQEAGCETLVTCLDSPNAQSKWCEDFAHYLYTGIVHGREKQQLLEYSHIPEEEIRKLLSPYQENCYQAKTEEKNEKNKKVSAIIFFTLFLDLVGFSLIFPLFPQLLEFFRSASSSESNSSNFFSLILSLIEYPWGKGPYELALFGGLLGAFYSFLQFFAGPFWGGLSDRIGRRKILLLTTAGMCFSYILWAFSNSFEVFLLSRFLSGLMGGNISVATAAMADITTQKNRSKGMALIGIAFALGFILGPALGGMLSLVAGPFAFYVPVAIGASLLSFLNFIFCWKFFKETYKPVQDDTQPIGTKRALHPFRIFSLLFKKEFFLAWPNFFFTTGFSGMEFTLTFLSLERFQFGPLQNAGIFVFVGILIALIQGGVVRRKAASVGEKKMALMGLLLVSLGLLVISFSNTLFIFFLGLALLATGSSMAIACLSALMSLSLAPSQQGEGLGVFRSAGALGRALGPLTAGILFWKLGPTYTYLLGAIFVLVPFFQLLKLKFNHAHHS